MAEDGGWGFAICDGGAYNVRHYGPFASRALYNLWIEKHCPYNAYNVSSCPNDVPKHKHDYQWLREPNNVGNGGLYQEEK